MTEDELVEQVARQLRQSELRHGDSLVNQDLRYRNMAREAIRLMEWARRCCAKPLCEFDCDGCPRCDKLTYPALTLPPDGWRPE